MFPSMSQGAPAPLSYHRQFQPSIPKTRPRLSRLDKQKLCPLEKTLSFLFFYFRIRKVKVSEVFFAETLGNYEDVFWFSRFSCVIESSIIIGSSGVSGFERSPSVNQHCVVSDFSETHTQTDPLTHCYPLQATMGCHSLQVVTVAIMKQGKS